MECECKTATIIRKMGRTRVKVDIWEDSGKFISSWNINKLQENTAVNKVVSGNMLA